ncbi:MAG: hypothetical protein AB1403_02580 [Candidatus Riflebacteria bacterium]
MNNHLKNNRLIARKIGFTIIEIVFAIMLLAFFVYFIANSFVNTKKQHSMNSEYVTKAYVADIVVKFLKERIEVNSNFLAGINGMVVSSKEDGQNATCLINPMSGNVNFQNILEKNDYLVDIRDIPVIKYSGPDKKEGFYFGLVEFKPGSNLFGSDGKGLKTFLNIEELEKFSYDLKIENDSNSSPAGIIKNIEISVRFNGKDEPDRNPFKLVTKIISPISSLSSKAYREVQKNLFQEIAMDIFAGINLEMERKGLSLSAVVSGIERDCKASSYSTMKIIDLSMPEKIPDRPRAEEAFKNTLILHCAIELYQQAKSEIELELSRVQGKDDVISMVQVMDSSIQKAQWALQTLEAISKPIDAISLALKPGGIAAPDPDAMFNYQVPILVMRYLLSSSEADDNISRIDRFVQIGSELPGDYSESLRLAFNRVNDLLQNNYKKLTARQVQKYSKDLLSFHQLVWINSRKLHAGENYISPEEYTRQASETINLIENFYRKSNYLAGVEFIECESFKVRQFNSFVENRFAEIIKKIEGFNGLKEKLLKLQSEVKKIDVVARGEQEVKLVSAPYKVNMEELSEIYISRGKQAVEEYLERCQAIYEASLRD